MGKEAEVRDEAPVDVWKGDLEDRGAIKASAALQTLRCRV